ncbi:MAG: prolyl oligopeptidase family serine peptidase [Pseudomonadota bacterium]
MPKILIALFAALLLAACGEKTITKPPADGAGVGMTHRDYEDALRLSWDRRRARPLSTTIWYPADKTAKMSEIAFPADAPVFAGGWAAQDAALAEGGKRPLVVLSHGEGGSALQMMWLGRQLAADGFIVAAVDHHGTTSAEASFDARGFMMPWERARDISAMIDELLKDPQFGAAIDETKIYGAGYSAGGYAMTALAGGLTSLSQFEKFCAGKDRDATCEPQAEFPYAADQFETMLQEAPSMRVTLAEHKASFKDPRIKSFVLIAPTMAQAVTDDSLLKITAPVLVIAGDADARAPIETNANRLAKKIRTSQFQNIAGARHNSFLDPCSKKGAKRLADCKDLKGFNRAAAHQQVAERAAQFFRETDGSIRP